MKNKRAWVFMSAVLLLGFTLAGAWLLGTHNLLSGFLLVAAVIIAKDLTALSAASEARVMRRAAYVESGVWRKGASATAGTLLVTVPGESYFRDAFSNVPLVNPATGYAMVGNIPGVDLAGNLYGQSGIDGTEVPGFDSSGFGDHVSDFSSTDFSSTGLES